MSMEDVNRQHIEAAGLDPDSLGRMEPPRCNSRKPGQEYIRCRHGEGHEGLHQRGQVFWENIEDNTALCGSRMLLNPKVLCAKPAGHLDGQGELDWQHENGPNYWSEGAAYHEPTKQREGDQVLPDTRPGQVCVQDLVIAEMEESKRVGTQRYGQPLMTFNGRRTIQDIREEARDLLVYLTQIDAETKARREDLVAVATSVVAEQIYHSPLTTHHTFSVEQFSERLAGMVVDRLLGHFTDPPAPDRDEAVGRIVEAFARSTGLSYDEVRGDWQKVFRDQAEAAYDALFGS